MERITYEFLIEAYKKADMIPTNNEWFNVNNNGIKCGCAFTAICASTFAGDFVKAIEEEREVDEESFILSNLNGFYPDYYIKGFIIGYDNYFYDNKEELITQCKVNIENISNSEVELNDFLNGLEDGFKIGRKLFSDEGFKIYKNIRTGVY